MILLIFFFAFFLTFIISDFFFGKKNILYLSKKLIDFIEQMILQSLKLIK